MQTTLIRTALTHEPVRANPIPGAPAHATLPGLEAWSRDTLVVAMNEIIAAMNAHTRNPYRHASVTPAQRGLLYTYNAEWNARLAYWRVQEARKDAAAHNDDIELRVEIMDALMAEGKARHVAADLTSTPAKMTAEGRRLGIL